MKTLLNKIFKEQEGQVLISFVFIFIVLCCFLGIVIDLWIITYNKQKLQDSVDLAALSAAQKISVNNTEIINSAINIAEKNGILSEELTVNYPYDNNSNKVEVLANKRIDLIFHPFFKMDNRNIFVRAVAERKDIFLNVALFSNSINEPMEVKTSTVIVGNLRGNGDINLSNKDIVIDGNVEAVGVVDNKGTTAGKLINNAGIIKMPFLNIEDYRSKATKYYSSDVVFNSTTQISSDEIIFVDGDVEIKSKLDGEGMIFATGNIKLAGQSVEFGNEGELSFFAGGDILFTGAKSIFSGIFYTYDGRIKFNMTNSTVYGKFYCHSININSNKLSIIDIESKNSIIKIDQVNLVE